MGYIHTHTHTHTVLSLPCFLPLTDTHTETHTDTHANIQEYCSLLLNWKPFFVILISFTVITFCLSHSRRLSLIISFVGFHFQLSSKLISISLFLSLSLFLCFAKDPFGKRSWFLFLSLFFFFWKNIYLSLLLRHLLLLRLLLLQKFLFNK